MEGKKSTKIKKKLMSPGKEKARREAKIKKLEIVLNEYDEKIAKIKVVNNTNALIYLTLLVLGFSENKYLARLYSASFLIKNLLGFFNFLPYRKLIILEVGK